MKNIFISLVLAGGIFSASAQLDSATTSAMPHKDSTPVTTSQNPMRNDSTGSMNNSMMKDTTNNMTNGTINSMQNDSTHSMNNMSNMKSDSSKSMTNSSMQNNMNSTSATNTMSPGTVTNSQNIAGQKGYAALPVLESYVSEDVVSKIKSKYPSVYDITPVKHTIDQMVYVVRVGDNGTFKTETVGEDGNTVQ